MIGKYDRKSYWDNSLNKYLLQDVLILNDNNQNNQNIFINNKIKALPEDIIEIDEENKEIIRIIQRNNTRKVGILLMDSMTKYGMNGKNTVYLCKMLDRRYPDFLVSSSKKDNKKIYVYIEYKEWKNNERHPRGEIIEYIGDILDENNNYEMLRYNYDLNFPRLKIDRSKIENDKNYDEELQNEITNYTVFSIDPLGSKDIDDAIHFKNNLNGTYEIGIHIASPTRYFEDSNLLKDIIWNRISTIYLPHKRYNLIPEEYSENLCSLIENRKRHAISYISNYDENDNLINDKIEESIILNRRNYNYEEIDDMINGNKRKDREIINLIEKTQKIFKMNMNIDSHKLIELWMIEINKKIAEYLINKDEKNIIIRSCEDRIINDNNITNFNFILNEKMKNYYKKREMKSALYEIYNKDLDINNRYRHNILNLNYYTHFSSPIRRGVDTYIHLKIRNKENLIENENLEEKMEKINMKTKNMRRLQRDIEKIRYRKV